MTEKAKGPTYERPQARDLSGGSASGQGPLGICEHGETPTIYYCIAGPAPTQDPGSCMPTGILPERGGCTTGGNAAEGCAVGSFHLPG